ncbi:hypothetical protein [Polyangium jinanense]|uniref:Uncharacterized protein n=1 Tax=Polyangium jinanense TaxID=2829994 RepID=A0A9X3XAG8_9BACT|nr:hypothetical protein [Polyangium jinanense]MDC3984461.1 hypothetical protein [Polyangium jinanense]
MDVIVLMAADRKGNIVGGCRFEFSIDGGKTFSPAQADGMKWSFAVPSASQLDSIIIRGTPAAPQYWAAEGAFKADSNGALIPAGASPAFFFVEGTFVMEGPAGPERTWGMHTVTVILFHLSIFRDRTQEAFEALKANADKWVKNADGRWLPPGEPTSWSTPTLPNGEFSLVTPEILGTTTTLVTPPPGREPHPPLVVPPLSFTRGRYSPQTTDFILERKQEGSLPKAFLVSWPRSLRRTVDAGPTPFLVYLTHLLNQNFEEHNAGDSFQDYPFGWNYLYISVYSYLNYREDPLKTYSRGLLYQIAASQKQLVLVIPVGDARLKDSREVGDCVNATLLEELLEAIQSFCFRAAGLFRPPVQHVGRVALASFSSGNEQLAYFLARDENKAHPFYRNTLREVYCFDIPRHRVAALAAHAVNWASVGEKHEEKVIRIYGTSAGAFVPVHQALLGKPPPRDHAYVASTAHRTVAVLPEHSWLPILPNTYSNWEDLAQQVHQLFCGAMLMDALRRSPGF